MSLDAQVGKFVQTGKEYYQREFGKIQHSVGFVVSWNWSAALTGPLWAAWRRLWGCFWVFLVAELFALVQIARGLWAQPGGEKYQRYERLLSNIAKRKEELAQLSAQGDQAGVQSANNIIANLERVAAQLQGELAGEGTMGLLIGGMVLLVIMKIFEGLYANIAYEKKYLRWCLRSDPAKAGVRWSELIYGAALILIICPLTIFRFTATKPDEMLGVSITRFPLGKEVFSPLASFGDRVFDWLALHFGDVFDGVTAAILFIINTLETLLIETPWPVVMTVLAVCAFRLAGLRVAIFTVASMAYLALMGLWEMAMITVALIGAGTALCLIFGIPLGIWFGRNSKAYSVAHPVLDFMQTMPSFVYLIPIIAFFGTGKPPGVLATIIFAMPPVVRLTALGIRNVPDSTKEAAVAFGCSNWQLLRHVELPLAMPSIMTGVNQTIMMGLSMVVVASLIGAEGLGALILEALQYAAKGQGLLGGLAILLCAMVIDRIAQGAYKGKKKFRAEI